MPKISIITTTYKHKDFIGYTIQSILDQTFSDWELLIGDDSPDDATWDVIQEYVKKYPNKIKARHHTPNKGIVNNMNFLLQKVSSDSVYIAFLEGDDMWKSTYLSDKIHIFHKYPKVKLVYNNFNFINANNKIIQTNIFGYRSIKTYYNQIISPDAYISASVGPIVSWSTGMIDKTILHDVSIRSLDVNNTSYGISDYDFYFQISTKYPVYYIDKSLTLYRRHQNNLSASNTNLIQEISDLISHYYTLDLISSSTHTQKISYNLLTQSLLFLEKGEKKKSFSFLKKAMSYHWYNYILIKFGIVFLLCIPKFLCTFLLSKLIKRG